MFTPGPKTMSEELARASFPSVFPSLKSSSLSKEQAIVLSVG